MSKIHGLWERVRDGGLDATVADRTALRQHRTVMGVMGATLLVCSVVILVDLGNEQPLWIPQTLCLATALVAIGWIAWRGRPTAPVVWVLTSLAATLTAAGALKQGLWSTGVAWQPLLILLSGILLGRGGTLFGLALSVAGVLVLCGLHAAGWVPTGGTDALWERAADHLVVGVGMAAATWMYATLHQKSRRDLEDTLERMSHEVEERARAEEEARSAVAARGAFLATMSHEIRTPMNGIVGAAHLLSAHPLPPEQRALLDTIDGSASTLLALLNDILDLSRLEARSLSLDLEPTDLPGLLSEVVAPLALIGRQKGIEVRLEVAPEIPSWVLSDGTRLRQVLLNLTSNAVKFTEQGHVAVRADRTEDGVRICVEDTGIGISEEALGRLFQPFEQADASTTRRFGGSGLGLSIADRIVRAMRGTLGVASEEGRGSVFTVVLPMSETEAPPESDPGTVLESEARRLLVVDDNAVNRMIIGKMLEAADHSVKLVASGEEALAALASEDVDVVLMDCQMPDMDGFETTRALRSRGYAGAIVALTANARAEDRRRALDAGMDDHLTKPVSASELERTVQRWAAAPTAVRRSA